MSTPASSVARAPVPAIDVHTHLFPERLSRAVRDALGSLYGWSFDLADDPDGFAQLLRERNIERFIVLPYAHKPGIATSLNEWVATACARLQGAIGFACVHPDDDVVATLEHAVSLGLRGVKLHHQVQQVAPDDVRLDPVYAFMLEHDLPLLVHAGRGPTDNGFVGAELFGRAMEKHPELRICVAHMGAPEVDAFVSLVERYPRVYLDTSGLGAIPLDPRWIERAPERIVFGSDAPNIPHGFDLAITRITDLGLDARTEAAVFRENARAFLGV